MQAVSDAQKLGRPFDLVLMDMQMPELDGYAATAKLCSMGYARPVIALTANAMKTDRDKRLAAGCTAYLSKPVDRRLLLQSVQRHMARMDAVVAPAEQAVPAAPATPASAVATVPPPAPVSPAATLPAVAPPTADVSPLDDGMAQLRRDFVTNLPTYVSDLNMRWPATMPPGPAVLHQLSGVGGVFGFQWITDAATVLDRGLRAGESLETSRTPIEGSTNRLREIDGYARARET